MSTGTLSVENGLLAYEGAGSGPLVLCVPSMGDLRGEYRFLIPKLASAGFRAVAMDVRGHGDTSTNWPDYSVCAIGEDIAALIRHLNGGPAAIIGTSMAAGAAVCTAADAPELVRALVLVGPFVRGEGQALQRMLFSLLLTRPWGPAVWLRYYASLYPSQKPGDFAKYTAALRANLSEPGRIEALNRMIAASKAGSEERLPRVKAPSLVIMGGKDPDFKEPEAEARWVANSLNTEYKLIPEAGHYPHAEMPEKTGQIILSFLNSL